MHLKKRITKIIVKSIACARWYGRLLIPRRYGDSPADAILKSLDTESFHLCRGFLSPDEVTRLVADIETYIAGHREELLGSRALRIKDTSIHLTRFGKVDRFVPAVLSYTQHPLILEVARRFYGRDTSVDKCTYEIKEPGLRATEAVNDPDDMLFFHTDRPYGVFKTILLLADVGENDGPFHIVRGSHRLSYKAPFRRLYSLVRQILGQGYDFTPDMESLLVNPEDDVACTGKAGDLYFVTTQAIHRGSLLNPGGRRVVLWNYFFNEKILGRSRVRRSA